MLENKKPRNREKYKFLNYISLAIPLLCILVFVNYFAKIIPFVKQNGLSLYLPLFISPFGIVISIFSLRYNKNIIGKIALVLNTVILFSQILFLSLGIIFMLK